MVTQSEFKQWQQGELYQELKQTIEANISIVASELVGREQPAPDRDQYLRGFVRGLAATLEWKPDFSTEEGGNDEI